MNTTLPLIPTFDGELAGQTQPLVNARDLHIFLESKQEFSTWINSRIDNYGFIDEQDFLIILSKIQNGGRPRIDYHLTLDMAKELSMVERSEKGRIARRYFIACEKRLYTQTVQVASDPLTAISHNMAKMADGMAVLAQASHTQMAKLDHTERYINLLELNQKGAIKVTPEVIEQVKLMKEGGYSQANIARMLRIGTTTVSQIVNDKYPQNAVVRDAHVARMVDTAKSVLQNCSQGELNYQSNTNSNHSNYNDNGQGE